ncbi:MAG: sodium:alanine symporter family protein [Lachnospiraceae bacterium]|nr:sodium:alanine symporter family protein [Lachnospiraceae bacterium]
MAEIIEILNDRINEIVWGTPMLLLIFGTGVFLTVRTGFFQVRRASLMAQETICAIFRKESGVREAGEKKSISQFQSLCTALAASIGVGNIAGVAAAITTGGPGAVFWMWISALFGMMTSYAENVLGIYYRRRNRHGEWSGGAMYYLRDGLGARPGCKYLGEKLAGLFAFFCILASFGIGNMSQMNTIADNMELVFDIPRKTTGVILMFLAGLVIVGGIRRIAGVTEKFVPFMLVCYVVLASLVFLSNIEQAGAVFGAIIHFAFGIRAVGGAATGIAVKNAVTWGFKRGIFSNEAGLGSSVMVHAASNVKEPVIQGMWGIFQVFADTILVCSLTAFAILSAGVMDLQTGILLSSNRGSALAAEAFGRLYHVGNVNLGSVFIALAILFFAFSTVIGWSYYGTKAWEYLFGVGTTYIYKILFVGMIVVGATMNLNLAWEISDTFNGLMAIPNLIGVLVLSKTVVKITKNYINRRFHDSRERPMISAFEETAGN